MPALVSPQDIAGWQLASRALVSKYSAAAAPVVATALSPDGYDDSIPW